MAISGRNSVRERRSDAAAAAVQVLPLIRDGWAEGDHKRAEAGGTSEGNILLIIFIERQTQPLDSKLKHDIIRRGKAISTTGISFCKGGNPKVERGFTAGGLQNCLGNWVIGH